MSECLDCGGRGYAAVWSHGSSVYRDEDRHIERCDTCKKFEDDAEAEDAFVAAGKPIAGVVLYNINNGGPCYV